MGMKEALARKVAWNRALVEGRVVSFSGGDRLASYSTKEKAETIAASYVAGGGKAEVVKVIRKAVGTIWREENRVEPWRVQCEDCVLGFKTEKQAVEFAARAFPNAKLDA
jgi:hypothetical protein